MPPKTLRIFFSLIIFLMPVLLRDSLAGERLIGIYSARVMSQSLPWIAQETGLFRKYDLDFDLVYVASSSLVTAAMLGGDGQVSLVGGEGVVRAYVQGAQDLVFIGAHKNILTFDILGRAEIAKPQDLKGKKIGVTRMGSNSHYFTVQALARYGIDPNRDVTFIYTGGVPETLSVLASRGIDAAAFTAPTDQQALALGFRYIVQGPDLRIPYVAVGFATRRSVIATRPRELGQFMRAMAEAAKILHTDKEFTYRVLGKWLRVGDRKILEAAYNSEIKALEPRLAIKPESLQSILDEVVKVDPRAKKVKPEDLIDRRYIDEMERSGFLSKLWSR